MESAPTVHHTLARMDTLKKGSMRPDNPLHVVPNDAQGTTHHPRRRSEDEAPAGQHVARDVRHPRREIKSPG